MTDNIHLRNIRLPLPLHVGPDAWSRSKPQPVTISVRVSYPRSFIASAAETDTVRQTLNYGELYREILASVGDEFGVPGDGETQNPYNLSANIVSASFLLAEDTIAPATASDEQDAVLSHWQQVREAEVWIHLPKAILRATQGLTYRIICGGAGTNVIEQEVTIEGIQCYCIIGVNPHERMQKQAVLISLRFRLDKPNKLDTQRLFLSHFQNLTRRITEAVDATSFQTVEALATSVARIATKEYEMEEATVKVEKPSAQAYVDYSGVEITRDAGLFT